MHYAVEVAQMINCPQPEPEICPAIDRNKSEVYYEGELGRQDDVVIWYE
jgi:hypothetical protein